LLLAHAGQPRDGSVLRWRLSTPDGSAFAEGSSQLDSVAPGAVREIVTIIVTFPMVERAGEWELTAEIDGWISNRWALRVYPPAVLSLSDLVIHHGEVGALELVDAHYIHRMDWFYDKSPWARNTTDWVFLGMSHPIDLGRWYLGRIEEVQAYGARSVLAKQYNVESFDIFTANFRAADGRVGRAMGNYGLANCLPRATRLSLCSMAARARACRSTTTYAICTRR
jgi:hypothetical protein